MPSSKERAREIAREHRRAAECGAVYEDFLSAQLTAAIDAAVAAEREAAADYCLEWALRGTAHPEANEGAPDWQVPPDTSREPYTRGWVDAMRHASSKIRAGGEQSG